MDKFVSVEEIRAEVRIDVKTWKLGPVDFAFSSDGSGGQFGANVFIVLFPRILVG